MAIDQFEGCAPYNDEYDLYGYAPELAPGIVFCLLFLLTTVAHVFQAWRTRTWWALVFAVGGLSTLSPNFSFHTRAFQLKTKHEMNSFTKS